MLVGRKSFQLSPLPFAHITMVLDILNQAGFQRNPKKGHLTSSQSFDFLGILRDLKELRIFLPQKKISDFNWLGSSLLRSPTLNLAQTFLGKKIIARGAHLRVLQITVIDGLHSDNLCLSNEAKASVEWCSVLPAALRYTAVYVIWECRRLLSTWTKAQQCPKNLHKEDGQCLQGLNILKICQNDYIILISVFLPGVAHMEADALSMGQVSRE